MSVSESLVQAKAWELERLPAMFVITLVADSCRDILGDIGRYCKSNHHESPTVFRMCVYRHKHYNYNIAYDYMILIYVNILML